MSIWKKLLALVFGFSLYAASSTSAEAQVRIYKVTFTAKARVFTKTQPAGNTFKHSGYIVYAPPSIGGPAAQTIEIFKNKTYSVNGTMRDTIAPGSVALVPIDRSRNSIFDHEYGLAGAGGMGRSYLGVIPRNPFRIGNVTFTNTARSVLGRGSVLANGVVNPPVEHFTITDKWTLDVRSGAGPVDTTAGVTLVTAFLASKGYVLAAP
jgi:hypothetical protein